MEEPKDFGKFFKDVRMHAEEYMSAKASWLHLSAIRTLAKVSGSLIHIIVSIAILFLALVFIGLTAGFWFSRLTGSYISGFGLATLLILFIAFLLYYFRETLFINPIMRSLIKNSAYHQNAVEDENK